MACQLMKLAAIGLVLFGTMLLINATATPTLKADKLFYTAANPSVTFDCVTSDKLNNKTVVLFYNNGALLANTSAKPGPNIKFVNTTRITVSANAKGFVQTYCQVNTTQSGRINMITYVGKVTFTATPNKFKVGQNFTATCNAIVEPKAQPYSVIYIKDSKQIGNWSSQNGNTWAFKSVNTDSSFVVAQGKATPPSFNITVNPKKKEASGKYSCQIVLPIGKGQVISSNNQWNTNGGLATLPSAFVWTVVSLVAFVLRY